MKHLAIIFSLLAVFLMSSSAVAAQDERIMCAVGYVGDLAQGDPGVSIIRVYEATPDQYHVDFDAGVCTNLIASGDWVSISNRQPVGGGNYSNVCVVSWAWSNQVSVVVMARKTRKGRFAGLIDCANFDQDPASTVFYLDR